MKQDDIIVRVSSLSVCESCKKRKRKCDRLLPKCTACSEREVDCDYSSAKRGPAFPPGYFVDYHAFQRAGTGLPTIHFTPAAASADSVFVSKNIADEYFQEIHWWMPVISKHLLYESFANAQAPNEELRLLLLAMRVIMWRHSRTEDIDPRTPMYMILKQSINEALSAGVLTLWVLQAQLLITIYEIGHAIYPAAYLSVGACSRYGMAMRLDSSIRPDNPTSSMTDLEREERRRTWWAILIVDRFIQLGDPTRPLSTEDPPVDSILPSDEAAFDQGICIDHNFTISAAPSIEMGMLARMSQSAFLLGRVYQHNRNPPPDPAMRQAEFWQLDRTIHSLLNLSYIEGEIRRMTVCAQTHICFSALLELHDPHSARYDHAHVDSVLTFLRPTVDSMSWDSAIFMNNTTVRVENASPLLLTWAYQAAKIYGRLMGRYGYEDQFLRPLVQMKEKLVVMSRRWKAGGAYLGLLGLTEY